MKKLLILSLLFCMLCSCANETDNSKTKYKPTDKNYNAIGTDAQNYSIIVIDSCEYFKGYYILAHKGNCRFCKERNENGAGKQIGCSK